MRTNTVFVFFFSVLIVFHSSAIDFSRVNIAWQYDPLAELEMKSRVIQEGDVLTVFLRVRTDSIDNWSYEFLIQQSYESEVHKKFNSFELDTLLSENGRTILKIRFTKPDENLLVVKVFKSEAFYYYDIPLKNGSLPFPDIYPTDENDLPIFDNYVIGESTTWVGSSNFYIQRYPESFEHADPPMAEMKPLAPSILPDTSFIYSGRGGLDSDYFYILRKDSNATGGVTFLRMSPYYPEFKKLPELVSSMYYILNDPEKKGMESSNNLKQAFDQFWVTTYTTKFRARNAIRSYFSWIKQANRLFSDFKQGWKTDRGMLFIVYGVPDEVYRYNNQEEWFYDNGPSFEFTVISTFFSPKTYALRRRIDYEEAWYEYIAAIRRGANE